MTNYPHLFSPLQMGNTTVRDLERLSQLAVSVADLFVGAGRCG